MPLKPLNPKRPLRINMKLINKTKGTLLAQDVMIADNPFKRMKGLLGKKELKGAHALILKPCNSIHTFFMRFPIDVLFVDKDNKVVRAISCLVPFRITSLYFRADFAIELPAGTIQSTSSSEGDNLSIE